jgi:hypothetical protein
MNDGFFRQFENSCSPATWSRIVEALVRDALGEDRVLGIRAAAVLARLVLGFAGAIQVGSDDDDEDFGAFVERFNERGP